MALLANKIKKNQEENQFIPVELNESNVKTIFGRCLATEVSTSKKRCTSIY